MPIGIAAGQAKAVLVDPDRFVETFAPLARDPGVQSELIARASEGLDVPALLAAGLSSLADMGIPPAALNELPGWVAGSGQWLTRLGAPPWLTEHLDSAAGAARDLEQLVAGALEEAVAQAATSAVRSPHAEVVWRGMLSASHEQLLEQFTGPAGRALVLDAEPIVAAVRDELIASGVTFARLVPEANVTVELLDRQAMAQIRPLAAGVFSGWLPWLPILAAGTGALLLQRRRWLALAGGIGAAVFLGAGVLVTSASRLATSNVSDPIAAPVLERFLAAVGPPTATTLMVAAVVSAVGAGLALALPRLRAGAGAASL